MGMSVQELTEAMTNLSEGKATKFKALSWVQIELAKIVNRRNYWWRRKALSFDSVAATGTYDLSSSGTDAADDFSSMCTPLYRWVSESEQIPLAFAGDSKFILGAKYSTTQDTPSHWCLEPGYTKVLRLSPVPAAVDTYRGLYWAGINIKWTTPSAETIPLLPPEYHYVALAAINRRAFFYLYGQKDPRYIAALQEERDALHDLDSFRAPSSEHAIEMRSSDSSAFVQATS